MKVILYKIKGPQIRGSPVTNGSPRAIKEHSHAVQQLGNKTKQKMIYINFGFICSRHGTCF